MTRRRTPAGFTLIELLVTLLVVGVAIALSLGLFVEAGRRIAASGRTANDPIPFLAFQQLRRDVREAAIVPYPLAGATGPGLAVVRASGERIEYGLGGDVLFRRVLDPTGVVLVRRPVLTRVASFLARTGIGGATVTLTLAFTTSRPTILESTGRISAPGSRARTLQLVLAPRPRLGGERW